MNKTAKKTIITFGLFLLYVAAYGAVVSLFNHLLRAYGYDSKFATSVLIASTIYVYYRCWKWMCRKLNLIEAEYNCGDNEKSSQNVGNKEYDKE